MGRDRQGGCDERARKGPGTGQRSLHAALENARTLYFSPSAERHVPDMETSPEILYRHVENIFPVFRSITGRGIRQTLEYISDQTTDFQIHHVASGTRVLDWTVPDEWNVNSATIRRTNGEIVIDWARCNLHLVHYSIPIHARVSRTELEKHLHWLPDQPDLIPYRTSYYNHDWGFCLSARQRAQLTDEEYDVDIRTELGPGHLSYGEVLIPATHPLNEKADEVLFSVHCCHPSLANDNASSIAIAIELIRNLRNMPCRHLSYRFLFIPGTIGSITWLARNRHILQHVRHGLVMSCLGDDGSPTYKQSRQGMRRLTAMPPISWKRAGVAGSCRSNLMDMMSGNIARPGSICRWDA